MAYTLFCSIFVPGLFQFCSTFSVEIGRVAAKSESLPSIRALAAPFRPFSANEQKPVNASCNDPLFIQPLLRQHQLIHAPIYRKARELPFNDPREPDQRTHIIEPSRPEALLPLQNLKTSLGELFGSSIQILIREWKFRSSSQQLHQLPVIFGSHLLGNEQPTKFQHSVNLFRIEIPMTVDHHIKGAIVKGQNTFPIPCPKIKEILTFQKNGCREQETETGTNNLLWKS